MGFISRAKTYAKKKYGQADKKLGGYLPGGQTPSQVKAQQAPKVTTTKQVQKYTPPRAKPVSTPTVSGSKGSGTVKFTPSATKTELKTFGTAAASGTAVITRKGGAQEFRKDGKVIATKTAGGVYTIAEKGTITYGGGKKATLTQITPTSPFAIAIQQQAKSLVQTLGENIRFRFPTADTSRKALHPDIPEYATVIGPGGAAQTKGFMQTVKSYFDTPAERRSAGGKALVGGAVGYVVVGAAAAAPIVGVAALAAATGYVAIEGWKIYKSKDKSTALGHFVGGEAPWLIGGAFGAKGASKAISKRLSKAIGEKAIVTQQPRKVVFGQQMGKKIITTKQDFKFDYSKLPKWTEPYQSKFPTRGKSITRTDIAIDPITNDPIFTSARATILTRRARGIEQPVSKPVIDTWTSPRWRGIPKSLMYGDTGYISFPRSYTSRKMQSLPKGTIFGGSFKFNFPTGWKGLSIAKDIRKPGYTKFRLFKSKYKYKIKEQDIFGIGITAPRVKARTKIKMDTGKRLKAETISPEVYQRRFKPSQIQIPKLKTKVSHIVGTVAALKTKEKAFTLYQMKTRQQTKAADITKTVPITKTITTTPPILPMRPRRPTRPKIPIIPWIPGIGGGYAGTANIFGKKGKAVGGRFMRSFTANVLGYKAPKKRKYKRLYSGLELRI